MSTTKIPDFSTFAKKLIHPCNIQNAYYVHIGLPFLAILFYIIYLHFYKAQIG
mgnify:CR=1 FL=1